MEAPVPRHTCNRTNRSLMRLFGITEQTAMRYVGAAHPERVTKPPR
ncbi:hypothetical protein [Streptomyces sp. NBC_01483]|nr:hypothetical protein [Streptomyces sp. NBC_01483]